MLIVEMTPLERALMKCSSIIRKWVNSSLRANIQCIEELASGAVYCQFMDMAFEGVMPLKDVIFASNRIVDFRKNFIMLKKCIDELQIPLMVPVETLVWCDFDANLHFAADFYDAFQDFSAVNPERVKNYLPLCARNFQYFSMEAPTFVSRGTDVQNLDELDSPVMVKEMPKDLINSVKDGNNQDNTDGQTCPHEGLKKIMENGQKDTNPLETDV
ncbi:microtubule-associated protein RP/EB family member 1-like [Drosophila teissieri]|uniref:microtubule-associated protein RP/EB family member 1-like n=1 Tax=Drosophila teissieri TaxID=7243 RepID=UPI001CBA41C5|nr:microtubule-associated protein RP/EB family member 1-like [Drosophila teissieri]